MKPSLLILLCSALLCSCASGPSEKAYSRNAKLERKFNSFSTQELLLKRQQILDEVGGERVSASFKFGSPLAMAQERPDEG